MNDLSRKEHNIGVAMVGANGDPFTREYYEAELEYAKEECHTAVIECSKATMAYFDALNRVDKARKKLADYGLV